MANDINTVTLIGRLTRDPELKSTNSGSYFCRFTLASSRTVYKKDSENKDEVGFFDCVAWGKLSEIINRYATKGMKLAINGSLRQSSWETPEGKKQSKVEIFVENFQFLDSKQKQDGGGTDHQQPFGDQPYDEDIPF